MTEMTKAVGEVLAERQRQIMKGWTVEHDDAHNVGEIITEAWGALNLLQSAARLYSKPGQVSQQRKLLRQSAAQIIAELERLDRVEKAVRSCRSPNAETRRLEKLESRFGCLGDIFGDRR